MNNVKRSLRLCLSLSLVLGQSYVALFGLSPALPARAAALTVTNTNDSGVGSLRQALSAAQPGDTITFNLTPDATITVVEPLTVTQPITVDGSSVANLRVSGGGSTRVFEVNAPVTLNGFVIVNGNAVASPGGNGGGVASTAALTLTAMSFLSNTANSGGGVFSTGRLIIEASRFANNMAYGFGGGVHSGDFTEVRSAEFIGNIAELGGGMHHYSGTTIINNALFARNVATSTIGAGLLIESPESSALNAFVVHSTFASPSMTAGSALHVLSGLTIVANSILVNHEVGIASQESVVLEAYNLFFGNGDNLSTSPCAFITSPAGKTRATPSLAGLIGALGDMPSKYAPICPAAAKAAVSEEVTGKSEPQADLERMLARLSPSPAPTGLQSAGMADSLQRMRSVFAERLSVMLPAKSEPVAKPVVIHRVPLTGTISSFGSSLTLDPAFVDAGSDDYHLTVASPAINIGADFDESGVWPFMMRDYDGDARPLSGGNDAGYDEVDLPTRCYATADDGATVYESYTGNAVQRAIDTHPVTGTVKAAGYCSGVQARNFITQTLYLDHPLTVRGGYTTTNWQVSDPVANATVLDAQGLGRVVYITGTDGTLENMTVQHGVGLETHGGGIRASQSLTLTNMVVSENYNLTGWGFGAFLDLSGGGGASVGGDLTLTNTMFISNVAFLGGGAAVSGNLYAVSSTFRSNLAIVGGGLVVSQSTVIAGSLFDDNHALGGGGMLSGLWFDVFWGAYTYTLPYITAVSDTQFVNNIGMEWGGGLWSIGPTIVTDASFSGNAGDAGSGLTAMGPLTLTGTLFDNNQSQIGGGLLVIAPAVIRNVRFISNSAVTGAGIYAAGETSLDVANVLFARNEATSAGSAVYLDSADDARLAHVTIVSPTQAAVSAIHMVTGTLGITNAIIASHTVGISAHDGTVIEDANVFFGNGSNLSTTVTTTLVSGGNSIVGDPSFVDAATDNYRLNEGSPAIDIGADAGVYSDIDDEPRPQRLGFDAGYSEWHYETITGLQAVSDSPTAIGHATAFTAVIATGSQVSYTWDFGDGNTGSGVAVSHTYAQPGAYTATVTATNLVTTVRASVAVSIIPKLMLPMVFNNFTRGPDLVVLTMTVSPQSGLDTNTPVVVAVTVKNQGVSPVSGFWVDLYLNPRATPAANSTWPQLCATGWPSANCYGGAWYVAQTVQPGETITLSSVDLATDADYSHWLSRIPMAGTNSLYAYVDADAEAGAHGLIHELNEGNNLLGPVTVTVAPAVRASRAASTTRALQPRSAVQSK